MAKSQVSSSTLNASFQECVKELMEYGVETQPRGEKVKEIINYSIVTENPRNRVITFADRKTSMKYLLGEFIWYLSGSPNVQDRNIPIATSTILPPINRVGRFLLIDIRSLYIKPSLLYVTSTHQPVA
jgi:hypothetical protein